MTWVQDVARRYGGIARAGEFAAHGVGAGLLRIASHSGELIRVRKGWYAIPSLGSGPIRAARVGGALACLSAAEYHGLWAPPHELHVVVPSTAARLRSPEDARIRLAAGAETVVHWSASPVRVVQSVPECIDSVVRCESPLVGFCVLESALHSRRIDRGGLTRLRRIAPRYFQTWIDRASGDSESGGESLLKDVLLELGIPFKQQVEIPGVGRVDFLVGDALIIEADSRRHHSDPARDRRRDAAASARGYRTLRFLYEQVAFDRDSVRAAILGAVVRGDVF